MSLLGRSIFSAALIATLSALSSAAGAQQKSKIEIVPQRSNESVLSVAYSPDGARVLLASGSELRLWDVATGQLLRSFVGHSRKIQSLAFSPDGRRVLSGSEEWTFKLWDAATGDMIRTFDGHSGPNHKKGITALAFSPDGRRIVSGGDQALKLWDTATGELVRSFGYWKDATSVAFSPDGKQLVSVGQSNGSPTIELWNVAKDERPRSLEGSSATSVMFSRDGRYILSRDWFSPTLWNAVTGEAVRKFDCPGGGCTSVALSHDSKIVLITKADGSVRILDIASGQLIRTLEGHTGAVLSVAFSPDASKVVSAGADKTLRLWDTATGQLVHTFRGFSETATQVAVSGDGARFYSSGYVEPRGSFLQQWDAATGRLVRRHMDTSVLVGFSPDGTRIITLPPTRGAPGALQDSIQMLETATGKMLWSQSSTLSSSVAFSRDGARVANSGLNNEWQIRDGATGRLIRSFRAERTAGPIALSPDGSRLIVTAVLRYGPEERELELQLWDLSTGRLVRTFQVPADIKAVAISPDGNRLLSGNQGVRRTYIGHRTVIKTGLPEPSLSGSENNTARLWDMRTGELVRTLAGHADGVTSVAFSPDGNLILTGSDDQTVKLWNSATGQLLRTFLGHSAGVRSAVFSPDGTRVISVGGDSTLRVWAMDSGELLVTLIGREEWLAMTPHGFFAASQGNSDLLAIARGLELTRVGQVHQALFNPDLVREALAGDPRAEVKQAANALDLAKVLDSGPAPVVSITGPAGGRETAVPLVTLSAQIVDKGKGVGRIEWRVNGITVSVAARPSGRGPNFAMSQELALDPGENTIEVVAYNGSNLLASLPARTTIKFTGRAEDHKTKLHILAIGINAYADQGWIAPNGEKVAFGPLSLAVKDATAFGADMKRAATSLYEEVRVTYALDQDATQANLEAIIERISKEIMAGDTFILLAAAQGTSLGGRFYLIPQDYDGGLNPQALARRAIGQDRLQDWLANRIKAKRALILLDTCESGATIAGHLRPRADGPVSEAAVGRLHEATGRPVLTAAASGQFAYEGQIGQSRNRHGVFTWSLLDALRNGDTNANGTIELSELVAHVQSMVPKLAAQIGGTGRTASGIAGFTVDERQTARFGSRGEDFVLASQLKQ